MASLVVSSSDVSTPECPIADRPTRRRVLRGLAIGLGTPVVAAAHASQIEPFWPEFHELPMSLPNLPAGFDGFRIAHLSDLHVSPRVPRDYLAAVIGAVNRMRPDLVVLTGDLVTHGSYQVDQACKLLARLEAPALVTFGNHDYGRLRRITGDEADVASTLENTLRAQGQRVLRNAAIPLERGGARIWFTGLEDLWSGRFSPAAALASVPRIAREPVIALSHNPDTAPALESYGVDWILAGHTHGGQVRLPGYGAIMIPVQNRQWQRGLYQLQRARLYVSRGVGYLFQARFSCRPEVPTFRLTGQ
jgi:predicted MPP superfamily phosphohydrolase